MEMVKLKRKATSCIAHKIIEKNGLILYAQSTKYTWQELYYKMQNMCLEHIWNENHWTTIDALSHYARANKSITELAFTNTAHLYN